MPEHVQTNVTRPMTAPVIAEAMFPATQLFMPSAETSARRPGAKVAIVETKRPTLARFATPQSAYVMINWLRASKVAAGNAAKSR